MTDLLDANEKPRRADLKGILADPKKRRKMMTGVIRATQAREGIETTQEQADAAYAAARAAATALCDVIRDAITFEEIR
jgi:hypothetical protein